VRDRWRGAGAGRTCRAGGRSPGRRRRDPAAPGSRPLRVHHSSGAGVVDRSPSGTTSPPCRRTGLVPVSRPNLTERGGARGRRLDSGVYPWEGGGRFRGRRGCSPGRARGGGLPPWGWTLPHGGESAPKSLRERYLYGAPNHHGVTHGAIIGSSRNESESCCPQTRLVEGFAGVVGRKPAPLAGYSGMAGEPATMRVCGRPHRALLCGLRAGLRGFGYPAASPGARRARGRPPAQAWRGFAAGACNALNDASRSSPGRQPRSCLGSRRSGLDRGARGARGRRPGRRRLELGRRSPARASSSWPASSSRGSPAAGAGSAWASSSWARGRTRMARTSPVRVAIAPRLKPRLGQGLRAVRATCGTCDAIEERGAAFVSLPEHRPNKSAP